MNQKRNDLINLSRTQAIMDENNLDALVATTISNVFYITGVLCDGLRGFPYDHQTYAVITRDKPLEPYYITSQGLLNQALDAFDGLAGTEAYGRFYRAGPFDDVNLTSDEQWLMDNAVKKNSHSGPLDALAHVIQKLNLSRKKIGIDEINFKHGFFEALNKKFPAIELVQASSIFRQIRKVKTSSEIARLKKVTRINENAIQALLGIISEGITEHELALEYSRSVSSQGGIPAFTCIRFGRNGVMAERKPDRTELKQGEAVFIDVGCEHQGYWADFGRTACLGEPNQRLKQFYRAIKTSHLKAIEFIKPGMTGKDVFSFTIQAAIEAGLTHYERHHTGHGIGTELYEYVLISPGNSDVIEEGTVINHESPYYEFGLGGLIIENPFVVRSEGNQLLTTMSSDLLIV